MKAFFRYLRGELLNGFYIRKLNLVANTLYSMTGLKEELLYWINVQFDTETDFYPMRNKDIKGIAQVAGILSIRGSSTFLIGWFRLAESYIVALKERSERGLLDQTSGDLEYIRTTQDEYPTDISTDATEDLRMSLIPEDIVPIGYVWGDTASVVLDSGKVDETQLHPTPPDGYVYNFATLKWDWTETYAPLIYAPWYGDEYLPLAMSYHATVTLPDEMTEFLLVMQQKIKYNGLGLGYLLEATSELVPDLIEDLKLQIIDSSTGHVYYYKMTFTLFTDELINNNGYARFAAWAYFIQSKYPFIRLNETGA